MTILKKARKITLWAIFNVLSVACIMALCEGFASITLFMQEVETQPLAERQHTQYDELLGWVNSPNLYIKDMYGPGIFVQTNSRGFRNTQDFSTNVPDQKIRLICSGDSFTFGYGVDNDHTWCNLLTLKDARLETVNMGQGGYGVDQAYLWYKRDAAQLEHQIHLFAFITSDFKRMGRDEFNGYGKPLLRIRADSLVVTNIPVPNRFFLSPG
jgi:hypothetical protein